MKLRFLLTCILFSLISLNISANNIKKTQKTILQAINVYREMQGLLPLTLDNFISKVAAAHSEEMANNLVPFGHRGFENRINTIAQHFKHNMVAENVAYTSEEAATVVSQWLASKGHRKNIEGNYNLTGIGIAYNKYGYVYVTQIFLKSEI
jgi:uncharacterized protein YkwD